MRITTWAEYGVICALHLAKRADEGPVAGRELAQREKLPADYVEQILLRLRRAGIIASTRGAKGGYVLARPADKITLRDVIAAAELETFDLHCVSHPVDEERCSDAQNCSIRPVWLLLQSKINDVLASVLISDLLVPEADVRERVGLPVLQA
jgi:Rrf2 family protein